MSAKIVRVTLLTWGSVTASTDEMLIVARHWRMVVLYVVSSFLMYSMRYPARGLQLEPWLDLLIFIWLHMIPLPLVLGTIWVIAKRSAKKTHIAVFVSPIIFLSILFSAVSTEFFLSLLRQQFHFSVPNLLGWTVLSYILSEVVAAIAVHFIVPTILVELRATLPEGVGQIVGATDQDVSQPNPDSERLLDLDRPMLTVGDTKFPIATLLYARAEGNYVDLIMTTGRHFALATLASVTDQVQEVEGIMLSRSIWISAQAITGFRRDGKYVIVTTIDQREFRVARSRNAQVIPWLSARLAVTD